MTPESAGIVSSGFPRQLWLAAETFIPALRAPLHPNLRREFGMRIALLHHDDPRAFHIEAPYGQRDRAIDVGDFRRHAKAF